MRVATLEAVVRALNGAAVPFIVVGGVAVNAHGYGRTTLDLDLVVRLSPDHVRSAFGALAGLGYRPRVPVTAEGFSDPAERSSLDNGKGMTVLAFHSDGYQDTPVYLFAAEPFDFDDEYRHALVEELAPGVPVRIVRLATLIALKLRVGRPQDLADVAELRLLHGGPEDV